jgi:pimeloyl-ACP methyl ester carboxylesterase
MSPAPGARRRRHRRTYGLALALALPALVGACGSTGATGTGATKGPVHDTQVVASPTSTVPAAPATPPISWSPCAGDASIQCGVVVVPVDYAHPDGPHLTLSVSRAPALVAPAAGSLFFNPGGPGESGNQILSVALALLPSGVRRDFDVVTFDPRGTGASDPLTCGTPPAALTSADPVPSGPGKPLPGTPVFTSMARSCAQSPLVPFIDTTATARDMDRIRAALGLSTISYYGLSYGTVLGTEYADLFPTRVRAMVLDGAVDVNASLTQQADEAAPAEERSLQHLLHVACAHGGTSCPLGAHPRTAYQSLVDRLRRQPLPAPAGSAYPVTLGDLDTAALFAVSVPETQAPFMSALGAAEKGDGGPIRSIALQFQEDVDGAPLEEALWAITCNDAADHPGPVVAGDLATTLQQRHPLLGAYAATYTMGGCVAWAPARSPITDVHPRGAPPILVVGNTGDPNTPYIGARHLAAAIASSRLLTWKGWGHTWLLSGSGDPCMRQWVSRYLSGGGLPPRATACS